MKKTPSKLIRKYTTADQLKVLELFRFNTPAFFDPSEEKDFKDYLKNQLEDYFVVEGNRKIIGAGGINYFAEKNTARIAWDMIHPDFHKKGIGKELTIHRLSAIRNRPDIHTVIVRTSQLAFKFYEKLGFEQEDMIPDFWAKGFHLYQMKLNLRNTGRNQST
ncbi:GNAT family N-acetyltransferase [Maribellus maritimus]|uniref:GNAT family N-acetyltransferase n=1 Tax=Maribellus maritimus TaxID=2870838 RepID=UPI001EEB4C47|nr:GNAT family N-acetyltransferase [Maribellus maritimus]MCG6186373.1 GNAT family N-acetyltransferase [Maribellus maritimus]